jgi:putative peptide zinc metalloprotease protein
LAPGAELARNTESGAYVIYLPNRRVFELGSDLGQLCQHLFRAETPLAEDQIISSLGVDSWDSAGVHQALAILQAEGMAVIAGSSDEPAGPVEPRTRFRQRPPAIFTFTLMNPDRLCQTLRPLATILTGRTGCLLSALGVALQTTIIFASGASIISANEAVGYGTVLALCLTAAIVHEFAHGIVLAGAGGHPRRLGFMLLFLIPAFFCDVSESWKLGRRARLATALAGIAAQCQFGALFAPLALGDGSVAASVRLFWIINLSTAAFNLLPFLPLDGYLALSTLLDKHNLRARALEACRDIVRPRAHLTNPHPSPWLIAFGTACLATPPLIAGACLAALLSST